MAYLDLSRVCAVLGIIACGAGCRSGRVDVHETPTPVATAWSLAPVQRSRNILPFEEIVARGARTAYDAIVQLRPEFLKPASRPLNRAELRTSRAADELLEERDGRFPAVFLNGQPHGGPSVLRSIPAATIIEIRYYPSGHVPVRYGINIVDGLIDVRTKPASNP